MSRGNLLFQRALSKANRLFFFNIYTPNKTKDHCTFFEEIQKELDELKLDKTCDVIVGGDFNVILDADLDGTGGKPLKKNLLKILRICVHLLI